MSLALPLFALAGSRDYLGPQFTTMKAECQSAEEEAKELEKLLQSESGGMAVDPEEMQQMIAEHRNKGKPKPPSFMHFMMPLKTF